MEVNKKFYEEGYHVDVFLIHGPKTWKIVLDKPPNFDMHKVVCLIENLGYNVIEINLLNFRCVNIIFKEEKPRSFFNLISIQKVPKVYETQV
jgi:hypothetical protein